MLCHARILRPHESILLIGGNVFQAANQFSAALASSNMAPLIAHFGLGADATAAARAGDMQAFVRAIQTADTVGDSSTNESAGDKKKEDKPKDNNEKDKDGDSSMSVDWYLAKNCPLDIKITRCVNVKKFNIEI